MKYRVLNGAAPEIYGREVAEGDTISLTKGQAEHLLAKGQIEPVDGKPDDTAEKEADAAQEDADVRAMLGDDSGAPSHAVKVKGGTGGVRA